MKTTPYYILWALLALLALPMSAQTEPESSDSSATRHFVHQLMFDYRPGAILHTNDFLRGKNPEVRTMNHDMGYYLKYAFSAPEGSEQARIYRDAYQGIGIGWNEFNPQLGNPVSVFLLQGARIASLSNRLALNYEWNLGLTFGWKPYDEIDNPDNKLIGSRVTAYIGFDLYLRWIASRHVDLNFGLNVTHYSNGNTQFPNLGLNTAALRIGAAYYINRHSPRLLYRHEAMPAVSHDITYDLILYGAWHQRGYYMSDGEAYILPGTYAVAGFNFNPMYRFNHWLKAGLSLDGTYDRGANVDLAGVAPESVWRQMALGASARVEFCMPYFAINFGIGSNFVNATDDFHGIYELLALKLNLSRRFLLHIGYCLNDFHRPKHLMLGVGWRFGHLGRS
ncbi:acyloxyacyl hydrolase [uncultured Prevotella sp.]|uniref:acyloxyacyl hydrolase n=1 Tax=uncultured Prevotella sp. TaxID=159272 RepID=UPI002618DFC7|nr:acyloxyacyl hydrolase [uncultured Prevotella sp.]